MAAKRRASRSLRGPKRAFAGHSRPAGVAVRGRSNFREDVKMQMFGPGPWPDGAHLDALEAGRGGRRLPVGVLAGVAAALPRHERAAEVRAAAPRTRRAPRAARPRGRSRGRACPSPSGQDSARSATTSHVGQAHRLGGAREERALAPVAPRRGRPPRPAAPPRARGRGTRRPEPRSAIRSASRTASSSSATRASATCASTAAAGSRSVVGAVGIGGQELEQPPERGRRAGRQRVAPAEVGEAALDVHAPAERARTRAMYAP